MLQVWQLRARRPGWQLGLQVDLTGRQSELQPEWLLVPRLGCTVPMPHGFLEVRSVLSLACQKASYRHELRATLLAWWGPLWQPAPQPPQLLDHMALRWEPWQGWRPVWQGCIGFAQQQQQPHCGRPNPLQWQGHLLRLPLPH